METTSRIRQQIEAGKKGCSLADNLTTLFRMIDLTSLEGTDNTFTISKLCQNALDYTHSMPSGIHVAAVCVYPVFAGQVSAGLRGTGIKTACVAGGFPSGQMPLPLRLDEARYALDTGAEEIDMVISRGCLLSGEEDYVRKEVRMFAEVCRYRAHLKVILETGELKEEEVIRKGCRIALEEGADFLKTSTGKIQPAATLEAFAVMLDEIRIFFEATGEIRGIKAAGGIAEPEAALDYYYLTRSVLGDDWLTPERLRFGASRLTGKLAALISPS